MSKIHFYKYQATGNDFVLLDNREGKYAFNNEQIRKICDRRFGIGADGLILLERDSSVDFKMIYYNSDGSQSLCGNGCRSAIDFASQLGIVNGYAKFSAYDGMHEGTQLSNGLIRIRMNDVQKVNQIGDDYFINTGSPHLIRIVDSLENYPVVEEGRKLRYSDSFGPAGTNVNFVELRDNNTVFVRTYERGVEDETLSCGTGVTAVAIASSFRGYQSPITIKVVGGELSVEFKSRQAVQSPNSKDQSIGQADTFHDIFLTGPAKMVFQGDLEL